MCTTPNTSKQPLPCLFQQSLQVTLVGQQLPDPKWSTEQLLVSDNKFRRSVSLTEKLSSKLRSATQVPWRAWATRWCESVPLSTAHAAPLAWTWCTTQSLVLLRKRVRQTTNSIAAIAEDGFSSADLYHVVATAAEGDTSLMLTTWRFSASQCQRTNDSLG